MRKPWCTSNSFVCVLLNVPRIPKPAHLRRASILRSKILAEVGFTSTEHFNYPWVKPPAARETKKRAERRVTSVFAVRKPWCTSNSFVCVLLNVPRIPKPAHLRRASILRSKILAEVGFTSTEHFNYPWVKPPAARETKKRAERRVTSVFAVRKPWCTSNSFVCALLNVLRIPKRRAPQSGALLFGGPEGIRTHDLTDANRTLSQTVHLYAPQTTRKSTLIHRILSQKIRKCIWPRFILRLKMSTNRSKKLSCIITRILLGCQHNGNNTVRIPLGEC